MKPSVTLQVDASPSKKSNSSNCSISPNPEAQRGCFSKQNLLSNFKPNLAKMLQFSKFSKNAEKFSSDTSDSGVMSTSIPNLDSLITPLTSRKIKISDKMNQSCYGALSSPKATSDIGPPLSRSMHQLHSLSTKPKILDHQKYSTYKPKESSSSKYRKYALVRQRESSSSLENRSSSSSGSVRDRRNSGTPRLEDSYVQNHRSLQYHDLPNIEPHQYHSKSISYHALPAFQSSQFSTQDPILMHQETSKTAVVIPRRYRYYDMNQRKTRGSSIDRNLMESMENHDYPQTHLNRASHATTGASESSIHPTTVGSVPDLLEHPNNSHHRRHNRLQTTFEAFSNETTTTPEPPPLHSYDNVDLIQGTPNGTPNGQHSYQTTPKSHISASQSEFNLNGNQDGQQNGARRSLGQTFSSHHNLANTNSTASTMSNSRSSHSHSSSNGQSHPHTPVQTPQPTKQMIVAPQPQVKRRSHNDENSNRHHYPPSAMIIATPSSFTSPYSIQPRGSTGGMSRSSSLHGRVGCTEEVFIDGPQASPSSGNDLREVVSVLQDRVRELESQMRHSNSPSTSYVIQPYKSSRNIVIAPNPVHLATQEIMAKEIADKEIQLQMAKAKLRECYAQMEKKHIEYDVEANQFKEESKAVKSQLATVKAKLEQLEEECQVYKQRTNELNEASRSSQIQAQEKIDAQEKEIASLRQKLAKNAKLREELEATKRRLETVEKERALLQSSLEERDRKIRELDDTVLELQMSVQEMDMKKSSRDSTPVPFDEMNGSTISTMTGSVLLEDIEIPGCSTDSLAKERRRSSAVGKSVCSSVSFDSNLSQCVTSTPNGKNLPPQITELLLGQGKKIARCKTLVQCLSDLYETASSGKDPNINRLLGCVTDTEFSETEVDEPRLESMSAANVEKWLRKQSDEMLKVQDLLDKFLNKAVDNYKEKMVRKDENCHLQ